MEHIRQSGFLQKGFTLQELSKNEEVLLMLNKALEVRKSFCWEVCNDTVNLDKLIYKVTFMKRNFNNVEFGQIAEVNYPI